VISIAGTSRAPVPRGIEGPLALLLFGGTALVILHDWAGLGGSGLDDLAGGHFYDAVVIAAGIACLLRSRAVRAERRAWILFGSAILCWAAGEVYWTWFILDNPAPPYPSPADVAYLAFYPLAYAGIAYLVRARARELDWRLWTDGLIAALGTAALGTAFVFDFVAERTTGTTIEVVTTLAYPLGDIVLLGMVVGVVALNGWRPGRTWSLLLAGLTAQVAADIAYTLQATDGALPAGNWIDPLYLISAAFLGALLWQPATTSISSPDRLSGRRELMVPALIAVVLVGLFVMQNLRATSGLSTLLWSATMIAVVARLGMSVRENRTLLEQVRTDSLTGLGNRGRMQVDLDEWLARASEENPAALYLFDLNGFKRFNDTFGHPAGDELLIRLGNSLRSAVGTDGTAYRIGGDEFCVLVEGDAKRCDEVVARAAGALSASEKGVDIGASWGGVAIPAEAGTQAEALQLADVRMYAQKEPRRVAPGGPDEFLTPSVRVTKTATHRS
jgi:diguanylate cyclase (GGDEF)-like protein